MTTQAMGKLLDSYLTDLEGQPGFWRGVRNEVPVFVFSDDEHDRMRIMSPIGVVEELEPDLLHVLLQANYDRALDARYAMRNNELWSMVVHPLATLATDDLPAMFDQVTTLVKNTGSTFASTELVFRSFPADQIVIETEDDEDDEDEDGDGAGDDSPEDDDLDEDEGQGKGGSGSR
ncbi:MAG: type III secretion system chaperone [Candidatus Eisenbacteria bacterium]|nr:type III secretion system chaperone [Candidatus Eisenbacteria bacterium]